jgi:hypothetical protein
MEWRHKGSPPPKRLNTQLSAGKIMASVFWDSEGVVRDDLLPHDVTITAQCYSNLLPNDVHQAIRNVSDILQHENARPRTAPMGWGFINYFPNSPDLSPSDFYIFGAVNMYLRRLEF